MHIACGLIGENNLLISCGEALLARHHDIRLVISPLKSVRDWAQDHAIPCFSSLDALQHYSLDYLFSIVNSHILTNDILKTPGLNVINYHDALLPDYAGLHATTWSIINGETCHGVTWHRVNEHIDEGEILCQQTIAINADETTLSLNSRCFEAAIESFHRLLDALEQQALKPVSQDLSRRRYFGAGHLLPNRGFIDWQNAMGTDLERYCRALDFGHYNNPVGNLKLYLGNEYSIVKQLTLAPPVHPVPMPGTILDIKPETIVIAGRDTCLRINALCQRNGQTISIEDWAEHHGLKPGYVLPAWQADDGLSAADYTRILKSEAWWVEQLKHHDDHLVFQKKRLNKGGTFQAFGEAFVADDADPERHELLLMTALLLYLFRLNDYDPVRVHLPRESAGSDSVLLCAQLPLRFDQPADSRLLDSLQNVQDRLIETRRRTAFFSDIVSRYRELDPASTEPCIMTGTDPCLFLSLPESVALYFQLDRAAGCIRAWHRLDESCQGGSLSLLMSHFSEHIQAIIQALVSHADVAVNRLSFLSPTERHQLLNVIGRGEYRPAPAESIPALFDQQVASTPEATAIRYDDQRISYRQLWQASEAVAACLQSLPAPESGLTGIYLGRSPHLLAAMLGILKSGRAYVPLDIKNPLLKIESTLREAGIDQVITEEAYRDTLIDHVQQNRSLHVLLISDMIALHPPDTQRNQAVNISHDSLAYVLFTSGTTQSPRAVMISHANVINYCMWFLESTGFDIQSVIDFSSSPAFDLSVPCTIAPLLAGGQIAICADRHKTNPQDYLRHLQNQQVTHVEATPGYLNLLLNYPDDIKSLTAMRCLLLGADVVPTCDVLRWMDLCPDTIVFNEYGPTETTVSATSYRVTSRDRLNECSVPIGRPAFNSQCYLLDKFQNLCPMGMTGELHIGGAQVASGYRHNDRLTQEKFFLACFQEQPERLHKTGDMAYWLPDGNLQFSERNDRQVKLQGYRIDLCEIESALMSMESIHQSVVMLYSVNQKKVGLRASLVMRQLSVSVSELREYLACRLPAYMIPDEFYLLDAIPLRESEKIDYHRLAQNPGRQMTSFDSADFSGMSNLEEQIRLVWQRIIKCPTLALDDDFFEIGGDSLMALQLVTELKKNLQINLSLQSLFEYPSIARLAQKVQSITKQSPNQLLIRKPPMSVVPLSKGSHPIPLFLIHPIGGTVFCYKQLASHLSDQFTLYGIQDPNMNGSPLRFNCLEDMARDYLNDISKVYDGDDFFIGGASFGATVAFEMARQLNLSGKKTAFLGLFDGWTSYPPDILDQTTARSLRHQRSLNSDLNSRLIELELYRRDLLVNYQIPEISAHATLFKAEEIWPALLPINSPDNGWSSFLHGGLTIQPTPGDHGTMLFGDNARHLADSLQSALHSLS